MYPFIDHNTISIIQGYSLSKPTYFQIFIHESILLFVMIQNILEIKSIERLFQNENQLVFHLWNKIFSHVIF